MKAFYLIIIASESAFAEPTIRELFIFKAFQNLKCSCVPPEQLKNLYSMGRRIRKP